MHLEHYDIIRSAEKTALYEFISTGPRGAFRKAVLFTEINLHNVYNLGFGDLSEDGNEVNDLAVTDNGDTQKVLSTVAQIVLDFTERNPDAMIVATGSTLARTRLYRMGITIHFAALQILFDIYGYRGADWRPFEKGIDYEAYYVVRKK